MYWHLAHEKGTEWGQSGGHKAAGMKVPDLGSGRERATLAGGT